MNIVSRGEVRTTSSEEIHEGSDKPTNHNDDATLFPEVRDFRMKHKPNFIYLHININSIRHKFGPLHEILANNYVDYLAVSESKIDPSFPNGQFHVHGFTLHRQDNTSMSGGLMVYIRSDIPHRRLRNIEYNDNGIETLCCELTFGKSKTVITCI